MSHPTIARKPPVLLLLSILILLVFSAVMSNPVQAGLPGGEPDYPDLHGFGSDSISTPDVVAGSQHWATLMCKFADVPDEPQNASFFEEMFERTTGPSLDGYWREASYENISAITADAHGWFSLPNPRAYYGFSATTAGFNVDLLINECISAADAVVDFSAYDAVAVMLNAPSPVAITTLFPINYPDGAFINFGAIAIPSNKYNLALVAHEMGHAYGLPHSSANGDVYQNPWDLMGIASGYNCTVNADPIYSCLGQHPIASYKDQLGWIPPTKKFEAPGGESTITLERLAQPQTTHYLLATIAAGAETFVVEARQRVGYDTKLAGDAVLIHKGFRGDDLIDPNGAPYDDAGAMWLPGETFEDTANGVSVRVDSATATGFVITINNQNQPAAPSMELQLTTDPAAPQPGGQVNFQSMVIYQDPALGAATNVQVTVTFPPELVYIPGSAAILGGSGTVSETNPLVFGFSQLDAVFPVFLSYSAALDAGIIDPTFLQVPVEVTWDGGSQSGSHTLIANAQTLYLPAILK